MKVRSRYDMHGQTALVTGGGGLLGRKHTEALAEMGARVLVGDISMTSAEHVAKEVCLLFPQAQVVPIHLDVTSWDSITAVSETIDSQFSGLNILINNAAIDPKVKGRLNGFDHPSRVEGFPIEQWQREVDVGLTGTFLCCKKFGSRMANSKGGVILNISSDLSVIAPDQRLYRKEGVRDNEQPVKPVTYSVIKTGIIGLTRYLASYWASQGVRVNALSPGGVYVDQPKEFVERLEYLIPMGRMADADDYIGAVQFLCSNASAYLTGQNIVMDGGRSII